MLPTDAKARKAIPLATGFADYFPDAMSAVAELSRIGNDQHNPGKPLHWDRAKSTDEADCMLRHFIQRGTLDTDGVRHSAKVAWRAMALLQKEIEGEKAAPLGRDITGQPIKGPHSCAPRLETKFGFTVGETVNLNDWRVGDTPGTVAGFTDVEVIVRWNNSQSLTHPARRLRHGA